MNSSVYCEIKGFLGNEDTVIYHTAFEYIKNDTLYIRGILSHNLKTMRQLKFNVYENIIFIPLADFGSEIMEYESQQLDSIETSKLKYYLNLYDTSESEPYYWYYLDNLTEDVNSKLWLGFSRIRGNRLIACVFCEKYRGYDFQINFDFSSIFIEYLFYFESSKIIKVFKSEGVH